MSLVDHYNETVSVERLATVSGRKKTHSQIIASLSCHIQPADESLSGDIEGGFGKNWVLLCGDNDIIEGDRVIWNSNEYKVVGVERHKFMGQQRHMELVLRAFKS
jgi:hypothetical protein